MCACCRQAAEEEALAKLVAGASLDDSKDRKGPAAAAAAAPAPVADSAAPNHDATALKKRLRGIRKKLRQIEGLEGKNAADLSPEQVAKVSKKDGLVREAAEVEALLAEC
mgnify:CR=1 FL=1